MKGLTAGSCKENSIFQVDYIIITMENERDKKRATDEGNLKAKRAEEKQNERDRKKATDEDNLRAKRVQEKQNERDQKRAMDEANLKIKRAEEKQNERDQKRATDEANLKAKRAEEKQNERDQKRATDEGNLQVKRAEEKQNERDQKRDQKREVLQNLVAIVIDEYSMIKADMLYQLDLRLREIKEKPDVQMGGVALFFFGDILQLRPVMARWIMEKPEHDNFQISYTLDPLWQKADVILSNSIKK